jgi:hypothetical protein
MQSIPSATLAVSEHVPVPVNFTSDPSEMFVGVGA